MSSGCEASGTAALQACHCSTPLEKTVDVEIRRFDPADLPQVHALFIAGMRYYHDKIPMNIKWRKGDVEHGQDHVIRQWNQYIQHAVKDDLGERGMAEVYLSNPRSGFWVALDRRADAPVPGAIIGIVGAESKSESVVELRRMSVSAAARGLGLGSVLVRKVEEHARGKPTVQSNFEIHHDWFDVVQSMGPIQSFSQLDASWISP